MPLFDNALTLMANALDAAVTHAQLHSGAPGAAGASNQIGTRVAVNISVDADGDLTLASALSFTGLTPNGAVQYVSLWSAASAGTCYGTFVLTGDTTANAAGEYQVTGITITSTAS